MFPADPHQRSQKAEIPFCRQTFGCQKLQMVLGNPNPRAREIREFSKQLADLTDYKLINES
jgi:hypothetical protein